MCFAALFFCRSRRIVVLILAFATLLLGEPARSVGAALPSAEVDGVHTIDAEGELSVFGLVNPNGGTVKYWFEFLNEAQFAEGTWTSATRTTPVETSESGLVWQEIPALTAGETYHFRVAVEDEAQFRGDPQYSPAVRALTVPEPEPKTEPACPNAAVRTGPSARLPDCRAYEQLTPADKEGAEDIFGYGNNNDESTAVGLDGEHLLFEHTPAKWGQNVGGSFFGESTYAFTRTPAGWAMTSLYPQPQTGGVALSDLPGYRTFYTPDLSQGLLEEELYVSPPIDISPEVRYELGPPGGPYTVVASEPEEEEEHSGHWVAQSRDGSVAVIESIDRELIPGERTGTTVNHESGSLTGYDLYEYLGGRLRQVNVYTGGATIGTCGSIMVEGREGGGNRGQGQAYESAGISVDTGSLNAVSSNGSRIFFEAFPNGCPSHEEVTQRTKGEGPPKFELYMRMNGEETVDIGSYTFEGANQEGTSLLLAKRGAGGVEYFSYNTETRTVKHLFSLQGDVLGSKHSISEDGNVYYFEATGNPLTPEAPADANDIYRYDIPSETMSFVAVSDQNGRDLGGFYTSPGGDDFYFNVYSVPGAGDALEQVYRYSAAEDVVQCISCASPFDPEPRLLSTFMPERGPNGSRLAPLASPASENGDFIFFDTPNALVPQDVNGEISPHSNHVGEENFSTWFSPSSDVYEWRREGIDGCGLVQGCLALITNGIDGTENVLLGVGRSGRDVFIGTHSQLVATDTDHLGDIYDARIDGGFPAPPAPPTECEGDECSTPPAAPSDPTQKLRPVMDGVEAPESVPVPPKQTAKKRKGKPGKTKHGRQRRARGTTRGGRGERGRASGSRR
jgi:hypothetical protein